MTTEVHENDVQMEASLSQNNRCHDSGACESLAVKAVALFLFIMLPFAGFTLGVWYGTQSSPAIRFVQTAVPSSANSDPSSFIVPLSAMLSVSEYEGYAVGRVESVGNRCVVDGLCIASLDTGMDIVWGGDDETSQGAVETRVVSGDTVVAFGRVSDDGRTVALHGDTAYFLRPVDECFLASFAEASKSGNRALPWGAGEHLCPEGTRMSQMKCPTSLKWCEPYNSNPALSVLEKFRVAYPDAPTEDPEPHTFIWIDEHGTLERVNGYVVQVTDLSLQDLTWGDRSVLFRLEHTLEQFFLSNGFATSAMNERPGPIVPMPGFVSTESPGLACVRQWIDNESEFIRYMVSCGFLDSLSDDALRRIDMAETSSLKEHEVILPNGMDLETYRRERGL